MIRELDILQAIQDGELRLPPLEVRSVRGEAKVGENGRFGVADAVIDLAWGDRVFEYVVEAKAQSTPKVFQQAVEQARSYEAMSGRLPMVVCPYLSPDRIAELEARGVSGIDLCGNGVALAPREMLVVRTGQPNRFPAGRNIRKVYQGASSMVARAFLLRPRYESVQEVMDEVVARGGRVVLSTVSKALKAMEEDLVVRREGRASELIEAPELMERLSRAFRPPEVSARKKYRWNGAREDLLARLGAGDSRLVLTGAASVERYAVMPREKAVQCYCTAIESVERALGEALEESPRFPDLDLVETRDRVAFFDRRDEGQGVPAASPVQCWLELQAGDKRQQDAAEMVRRRILDELQAGGWSEP